MRNFGDWLPSIRTGTSRPGRRFNFRVKGESMTEISPAFLGGEGFLSSSNYKQMSEIQISHLNVPPIYPPQCSAEADLPGLIRYL